MLTTTYINLDTIAIMQGDTEIARATIHGPRYCGAFRWTELRRPGDRKRTFDNVPEAVAWLEKEITNHD